MELGFFSSKVFKISLSHLETSIGEGELQGDESALRASLRKAAEKAFVVYAKPPFGGPEQVVKYLGRYTASLPRRQGQTPVDPGASLPNAYGTRENGISYRHLSSQNQINSLLIQSTGQRPCPR